MKLDIIFLGQSPEKDWNNNTTEMIKWLLKSINPLTPIPFNFF